MGFRCTVRLPDDLHERLQMAADARQCGLSDVIRLALAVFVEAQGAADHGAPPVKADQPALACPDQDLGAQTRPSRQPSPPVSGGARPRLRAMPSWEEFKRRSSQDSAALIPVPGAPSIPGAAASASTPAAPNGG